MRCVRCVFIPKGGRFFGWFVRIFIVWPSLLFLTVFLNTCGGFWFHEVRLVALPENWTHPLERMLVIHEKDLKRRLVSAPSELLATLPPDPGKEGKATLLGIDSNGDGLRDDLERFAAIRFHDRPFLLQLLREEFKIQMRIIASSDDADEAVKSFIERHRLFQCRARFFTREPHDFDFYSNVLPHDTIERYRARELAWRHFQKGPGWPSDLREEEMEEFCSRRGLGIEKKMEAERDLEKEPPPDLLNAFDKFRDAPILLLSH